MNFPLRATPDGLPAEEVAAAPVLAFVAEHEVALWHAADLLGGRSSTRLVDCLAEELRQSRRLSRRTRLMLGQIVDLLTLQNVSDFDRPEAAHFAEIDPSDPAVAEICWLADALQAAIASADDEMRRIHALVAIGRAA